MQGGSALTQIFSGYQIGPYSAAGLLWDVRIGQGQQALHGHIEGQGDLCVAEGLLVVSSQQVHGIVPAVAGTAYIAMEQGYSHGRGAWAAIGEAASQGWHKRQGRFFRKIAAHVELGMDACLNAANEFEHQATPINNGAIALLSLHPAHRQGLLGWTAHFRIGPGDKGTKLSGGAGEVVLFVDQGEQEGSRGLRPYGIVQQPLALPAPDAGEDAGWIGLEQGLGRLIGTDAQEERISLYPTVRIGHLDERQVDWWRRRLQYTIVHAGARAR